MKESINNLIVKIQAVTDMLYQQKKVEAIPQFIILLDEITMMTEQLFDMKKDGVLKSFDEQDFLKVLTEAMNALEVKDDILLADILNYDLTEKLEGIMIQL